MSAEILRRAAALMRERAEAAAAELGESASDPLTWRGIGTGYREPIKEHIASWHPAVALAVADWLDASAHQAESFGCLSAQAVGVARVYLGEGA